MNAFVASSSDCPADIVFVVDESGSIGSRNFELMKSFLSQLVSRLDIDSGSTRVGLVTYSTRVGTSFNLNEYTTVASVQSAIMALSYSRGKTNTADALAYVRTSMLTSSAGDRSNVSNVVVVLTDGESDDERATQVSAKCIVIATTVGLFIGCMLKWRHLVNTCEVTAGCG